MMIIFIVYKTRNLQICQFIIDVKCTWLLFVFQGSLFKVVEGIVVIALVNIFGKLTFRNVFVVENRDQDENYSCSKDQRSKDEILGRLKIPVIIIHHSRVPVAQ